MTIVDALLLGITQGLTEFLPVSSTGHLILARAWLDLPIAQGLAVDAALHLATAGAVLIYFFKDMLRAFYAFLYTLTGRPVLREDKGLLLALLVGTIPAATIGFLYSENIETIFRSTAVVALALIFGSFIMLAAEYVAQKTSGAQAPTMARGFIVGFFQALALIPGMSRSGMVISGGLLLGFSRDMAIRFGFMLSFPIILGAGGVKFLSLLAGEGSQITFLPLIVAGATSFVAGLLAIHFLVRFLKTNTLLPFVVYRFILAGIILAFL